MKPAPTYVRRDLLPIVGSFSDPRVILVIPSDQRACPVRATDPMRCHAGQAEDGPMVITIGPQASDSSLGKVAERYGIPLADLREFRNSQRAR
jgi:hypothetical protein